MESFAFRVVESVVCETRSFSWENSVNTIISKDNNIESDLMHRWVVRWLWRIRPRLFERVRAGIFPARLLGPVRVGTRAVRKLRHLLLKEG